MSATPSLAQNPRRQNPRRLTRGVGLCPTLGGVLAPQGFFIPDCLGQTMRASFAGTAREKPLNPQITPGFRGF